MNAPSPSFFSAWSWTTVDLLNHFWQSTAVALAVLVLLTLCGRLSANTRRLLGWMALVKFALPMELLTRLLAVSEDVSRRWLGSPTLMLPAEWSSAMFSVSAGAAPPVRNPIGWIATAVWLAVAVALLAAWIVRGVRLRRQILSTTKPISAAMERRIAAAASRVGVRSLPCCLTAATEHGPGALGVFSPILILPDGLENTLSPAELESVLIHEFVHLRRRDNLWGALQALFGSLFWFHPLVWVMNRRISLETEKSCDERVLEITGDPEAYADGIVKSVRHALGIAQPSFACATTPPVVKRIEAILAHGAHRDLPALRHVALTAGVLLLALSGYAGSFTATPSVPDAARPARITPLATTTTPTANPAAPASPPNAITPNAAILAAPDRAPIPTSLDPLKPDPVPSLAQADVSADSPARIPAPPTPAVAPDSPALAAPEATPAPQSDTPQPARADTPMPVENSPTVASAKTTPSSITSGRRIGAGIEVYDISKLDRAPVPKSQARPQYPLAQRRSGIQGEAVVDFIVSTNGDVQNAYAVHSSQREFEKAAVEAVSKWKFRPGIKYGHAVNTHMQVPIVFTLNEN